MKKVSLGSGSAFWGDMLEPAVEVAKHGNVDYIGFDHLAELTMAQLQRMKDRDPNTGYIEDIIPWTEALLPICHEKGIKMITNAGGVNPRAAAEKVADIAKRMGYEGFKIGVVYGDDLYPKMDQLIKDGWVFENLDDGDKDITKIQDRIVAANVYIGCDGIIECLKNGADMVIAGRVSDTALYIGPIMYEFGWDFNDPNLDWDRMGAAVIVGHTIECAECCTRSFNRWDKVSNLENIGFPIADFYEDGTAIIRKVEGTGGVVDQWSIKEQLMYEVHDPKNYIMPDGIGDFTSIKLEDLGNDQVRLSEMKGRKRPDTLKVQVGYKDGYKAEGQVFLSWPDAYGKALQAAEVVRKRFEIVDLKADEVLIDFIGVNMLHGDVAPAPDPDIAEVGLRVTARTKSKAEAAKVGREATHIWTVGGVGASYGAPFKPKAVISLWPTLVPREAIEITTEIMEVK